jgi:hypothetical protein
VTKKLSTNRRIVLAERPQASASPASSRFESAPIPEGRKFGNLVVSLETQGAVA